MIMINKIIIHYLIYNHFLGIMINYFQCNHFIEIIDFILNKFDLNLKH